MTARRALAGPRILLRPLADGDLPAIEEWWPEAGAVVCGGREAVGIEELHRLLDEASSGALVITCGDDPAPIGLLVINGSRAGWVEFPFLALAAGQRGRGYGSEAVRLLEESTRSKRFAACVYRQNGLGLYFWLRMGYRPGADWRGEETGDMIAMIREQGE